MITINEQLRQLNSEIVCKAHRFVRLQEWEGMKNKSRLSPETQIAPDYQQGLPEWSYKKYIFAISENDLTKWKENELFPDALCTLVDHIRLESLRTRLLGKENKVAELSLELRKNDEIYVLDYANKLRYLHTKSRIKTLKDFLQGYWIKANKQWFDYVNSRVVYSNYEGNYILPELAIRNPIELQRVRLEEVID